MQKFARCAARAASFTPAVLPRSSAPACLRMRAPLRAFSTSRFAAAESRTPGATGGLEMPEGMDDAEKAIWVKLRDGLGATKLEVQDVSGGCGSMYAIDIESEAFRGLGMLKQQRLVNSTIGEEIKGWHGVQLKTKAP